MDNSLQHFLDNLQLLNLLPDYIFLKDTRGHYVTANRNYLELIGMDGNDISGLTDYDLFSPAIAAEYRDNDEQILSSGKIFIGEEVQDLRDGSTRRIESRKKPIFNNNGEITGILGVTRDVSAERREQERHLLLKDSVIGSSKSAIILFDGEQKCIYQNDRAEELFGCNYPENFAALEDVLRNISSMSTGFIPDMLELESRDSVEIDELKLTGGHRYVKGYISRVRDAEQKEQGFCIVLNDITEQKINELRYRQLIEDANSIILQLDTEGYITYMNRCAQETFGFNANEIIGKKAIGSIVKVVDRNITEKIINNPEKHLTNENYNIKKSGEKIWVAWTNRVLYEESGKAAGILCIGNDITAAKKTEQELRKAKYLAERANELKNEFLANMSHELRTPLGGIMGVLDLIRGTELSDEQDRLVNMLNLSAIRLKELITDVLDFSMAAADQLTLTESCFCIMALAREIVEEYRSWTREKGIFLEVKGDGSIPPGVILDRNRTKKIIQNLVSNAVKFTEQGGITIRISTEEMKDDTCVLIIDVSDTGVGIERRDLNRIFEPFQQLDETYSKKHGGIGLGLKMAKALVDMMQGSIKIDSLTGRGSTFTVRLPAGLDRERGETTEALLGDKSLRVLIAEDESINRMYLETVMKKNGYIYGSAKNGIEVLELLQKENFDVILMDIGMPGMNGLDATRNIRKSDDAMIAATPVIALTAHTGRQDRLVAFDAGMQGFVGKPYLEKDIIDEIDRVLRER